MAKTASLKIELYTPTGQKIGEAYIVLNNIFAEGKWTPANAATPPTVKYTWVIQDACGPSILPTGIFQEQGFDCQ